MKHCSSCKKNHPDEEFVDDKGVTRATCNKAREKRRRYVEDPEKKMKSQEKWREKKFINSQQPENGESNKTYYRRKEHQMIDDIEQKHCSNCESWKPLSEFGFHSQTWDKLRGFCKECTAKSNKKSKENPQPNPPPPIGLRKISIKKQLSTKDVPPKIPEKSTSEQEDDFDDLERNQSDFGSYAPEVNQQRSETLKKRFQTPEGKEQKTKAIEKRLETMHIQKMEVQSELTEKECPLNNGKGCGKVLPISAFSKKKDSITGLQTNCRDCTNRNRRLRRQEKKVQNLTYPCHHCDLIYQDKDSVRKHIRTHHSDV